MSQLAKSILRTVAPNMVCVSNNLNLCNSITCVFDINGYITDLETDGSTSEIYTLLNACKGIMDNLVARGLALYTTTLATTTPLVSNKVLFIFYLPYNTTLTSTNNINLYQVDLSNFYTASASQSNQNNTSYYDVSANSETYWDGGSTIIGVDNAIYIGNLTTLINQIQMLLSLIADIASTAAY